MTIMKHTMRQRVYDVASGVLMIVVLFTATASAHAVDRATNQIVSAVATPVLADRAMNAPSTGFPVAGERDPRYTMTARISFYSSDPYQTDDTPCIPADGSDLCIMAANGQVDAIAANFLPLGTTVRFPELDIDGIATPEKTFVVRDRMNKRYNGTNYVDIYVAVLGDDGQIDRAASKALARQNGVKHVAMEVF